ncbi:long chain base biosynthesis protein 1 [Phtheirospermum japonicum]|uniref:serine C-palmitoyltransferase n=1 Tax=Phtheirospermum japonicum TaxID=374723 RepID=A0A830BMK5_9LAMI|nr:long chain base biosynthesis protein 1 [Phtheirospermum japonicum]
MDSVVSAFETVVKSVSDWVTLAFDTPSARAIVFGVPIKGHLLVEGLLFVVILFLLSQKSYKPPKRPLTKKEVDELCDEWVPEPLIPSITEEMKYEPPILESAAGPHSVINGKDVVNFTCADYLGLLGHDKLQESCTKALEKYGVGSCGPRGFYGTIDVHLDCEARIAKFLGTPDSILYSYGLSTMFSTIPAFCKKGDVVVVDEGVHWGIQNGLHLSRSTIIYFKHNDISSLQSILENVTHANKRTKKLRRYIVVEAVYQNSGQIAPLDEIIKLKEKYRFRVILDESNSIGVLGSSGRGLTEHCKVPIEKVDIVTAAMGHALATEGGFCTGSNRVIDHQRLSSSGYVFSASLPPYLASAAITAIDVLEENPNLIIKLKENVATLRKGLSDIQGLEIVSDPESPIVYLRLKKPTGSLKGDLQVLQDIADHLLNEHSIFVATTKRSTVDKCKLPAGIRLCVSAAHTETDLDKACESFRKATTVVLTGQ